VGNLARAELRNGWCFRQKAAFLAVILRHGDRVVLEAEFTWKIVPVNAFLWTAPHRRRAEKPRRFPPISPVQVGELPEIRGDSIRPLKIATLFSRTNVRYGVLAAINYLVFPSGSSRRPFVAR